MSRLSSLGIGGFSGPVNDDSYYQRRLAQLALHRVLEFTGWSIDDVVNNPLARNEVLGYYKLCRFVDRRCDEIGATRRLDNGRIAL